MSQDWGFFNLLFFLPIALMVVAIVSNTFGALDPAFAGAEFEQNAEEIEYTTGPGPTSLLPAYIAGGLMLTFTVIRFIGRQKNYPINSFGIRHRLNLSEDDDIFGQCISCESWIDEGERREFVKERVFLGFTWKTLNRGENYYCENCAEEEKPLQEVLQ